MTADRLNRLLLLGLKRADLLEGPLRRAVQPVLEQAGRDAAARFAARADARGELARRDRRALAASADPHGLAASLALEAAAPAAAAAMVCLRPTPEQAAAIAALGGSEPAEVLHVTLAYLGETDLPLADVAAALASVAAAHAPLDGHVGGVGHFADGGDGHPQILLPDVPGLVELYAAAAAALDAAGVGFSRDHGYQAHVTVDYSRDPAAPGAEALGLPLTFAELCVVRGDAEEVRVALTGQPLTAAGDPPGWQQPSPSELVDAAAVAQELRARTEPVRRALIEASMTPALEEAGLSFDVSNPYAAHALEGSGQHITDIAETTRADVARLVTESYREGLSVPATAEAIQRGIVGASPARARLIARTELVGGANAGSLAATQIVAQATDTGYFKKWLTAPHAPNPRHALYDGLNGQTRKLDEAFSVGGYALMHPGDPNGPAGEVCNCRCSMTYTDQDDTSRQGIIGRDGTVRQPAPPAGPPDTVSVGGGPPVPPELVQRVQTLGLDQWPPAKGATARSLFGNRADTTELYKTDGKWSEQRRQLHARIAASHFEGKAPAAGQPTVYMTAGGGASGKSAAVFDSAGAPGEATLDLLQNRPDVIHVDPDAIKAMLPEYRAMRDQGDYYAASGVHEESSELAKMVVEIAQRRGYSIILDTTGSSRTFADKIAAFKDAGYRVEVTMFSVPTNTAVARSISRGDRTGRYVAIAPLKYAHAGASRQMLLWTRSGQVDSWRVYDNSGAAPALAAKGGRGATTYEDDSLMGPIRAKADEAAER